MYGKGTALFAAELPEYQRIPRECGPMWPTTTFRHDAAITPLFFPTSFRHDAAITPLFFFHFIQAWRSWRDSCLCALIGIISTCMTLHMVRNVRCAHLSTEGGWMRQVRLGLVLLAQEQSFTVVLTASTPTYLYELLSGSGLSFISFNLHPWFVDSFVDTYTAR